MLQFSGSASGVDQEVTGEHVWDVNTASQSRFRTACWMLEVRIELPSLFGWTPSLVK